MQPFKLGKDNTNTISRYYDIQKQHLVSYHNIDKISMISQSLFILLHSNTHSQTFPLFKILSSQHTELKLYVELLKFTKHAQMNTVELCLQNKLHKLCKGDWAVIFPNTLWSPVLIMGTNNSSLVHRYCPQCPCNLEKVYQLKLLQKYEEHQDEDLPQKVCQLGSEVSKKNILSSRPEFTW